MAGLTRYTICDDYTIQELTRDYSSRDSAGRLELLKQLAQNKIPTEIGLLAVQDANPMVRQWMARYGDIKYNRSFHRVGDLWINEKLEPDLYDRLRTDPDAFVRASLLENPHVTFWHADDYFEEATQLERLALMHNVETVKSKRFLLKLFNVADTELDIGLGERSELIVAFFSNEALSTLHADTGLVDTPLSSSRYSRDSDARKLLRELWELAAMWPTDNLPAPVPELTFRYLLVDPETRARVYRTVSQPLLRRTIIEGCSKTDVETLKMAIRDSDEDCRGAARSVCYDLDLDKLLEPEVTVSISGLSVLKGKIEAFVRRHELLWPGVLILLFILAAIFTDTGSQLIASIPALIRAVGFVFLVVFAYFWALALIERYRWIYHPILLLLICWFYFIVQDSNIAGVLTVIWAALYTLPKFWAAMCEGIADKVFARLQPSGNK